MAEKKDNEKLKLYIDLIKWFIGSVVIVIVTLIIESSFKERTAGLQEMQAFNGYVETILKANNIEERWKLSEFFSTVTPTDRLRNRWIIYKESISEDYLAFRTLKQEEFRLNKIKDSLEVARNNQKDSLNSAKSKNASIQLNEVKKKLEPYNKKLVDNEEMVITGPTIVTPDLHEVRYKPGGDCYPIGDGKWCFKKSIMSIKVPSNDWIFIGTPYIEVVEDNQGAAGWNNLGAPDRFRIINDSSSEKIAEVFTASRSFKIRLACKAKKIR